MSTAAVRGRELTSRVRWSPFETLTAEGRAKERYRRAALTGVAATSAKIIAVLGSVVTIPAALNYLGRERFGLWMTISSIVALLSFADFGIGNGLMNSIADGHGREGSPERLRERLRETISSGVAMLMAVGFVISGSFIALYPRVSWARLFNVQSTTAANEAGPAILIFALCFALNVPLGAVQRVQLGLQQGYYANLWQLAGSVCGLVGVLVGIHLRAGLPWLVLAVSGAPVVAAAVNGFLFFGLLRRDLRPSVQHISLEAAGRLTKLGGFFFFLQMVVAAAFYSDSLIIAHLLGAAAVADYAVVQRMFMMISILLALFTAPLWPAYREAIGRGDILWVKKTLRNSLLATVVLASAMSLAAFRWSDFILHRWVHGQVHPPTMLLAGFALWVVFEAGGSALAMFLNGAGIIKFQMIVATLFGIGCVLAKLYGAQRYGVAAIPWAAIATYSVCHVIPCFLFVPGMVTGLEHGLGTSAAVMQTL
jgi:O-antigen/teichoic acid export membrane protein